jgi:hypothetical protein
VFGSNFGQDTDPPDREFLLLSSGTPGKCWDYIIIITFVMALQPFAGPCSGNALTRIPEVFGSNFGQDTDPPDGEFSLLSSGTPGKFWDYIIITFIMVLQPFAGHWPLF